MHPMRGTGNQILASVSALALSCLTSRQFFIEEGVAGYAGLSFTTALQPRVAGGWRTVPLGAWNASRRYPEAAEADLRGVGEHAAHSRLACAADLSAARHVRIASDGYFLKALLINPHHARAMRSACPLPATCFEVLFGTFFEPTPPIAHAASALSARLGSCSLGVHLRSAGTLVSRHVPRARRVAVGVSRAARCVRRLLPGPARGHRIWLASASPEVRTALRANLTAEGFDVRMLPAGGRWALPSRHALSDWSKPIFDYSPGLMASAALDLLLLSRCGLVLGTRHSTYSYVAQAIGSHRQARLLDEEDGASAADIQAEPCRVFPSTQPVYHSWTRYGRLEERLNQPYGCRSARLRRANPTRYDAIFDAEHTLPKFSL